MGYSDYNLYKSEYERYKAAVEAELENYLPEVDRRSRVLAEAMKYSLAAGGKRLRPVILLAACEMAGGSIEKAMPFACAIEFIHTYSLIHDDHPSMDNDELRRGKPTNHIVFGDDIAILAGDGLLSSAMDIMLEAVMKQSDAEERMRLTEAAYEISKAAGVRGMVAGQTADVMMTGGGRPATGLSPALDADYDEHEMLRYIHRSKTGALIRAAARAGAAAAGAGEAVMAAVTEYAENLGLTFQIVDDILDVTGDEASLGKKTGADEELGKLTYPSVYGLEESYRRADAVTAAAVSALEALRKDGAGVSFLADLAYDMKNRIS